MYGSSSVRISQPALPQPPRSWLRKMSVMTLNSRNSHMTQRKNQSMVQKRSSKE